MATYVLLVKLTDKGAKITEMLYGIRSLISASEAAPQQAAQPPAPAQQATPKEKEPQEKKQP